MLEIRLHSCVVAEDLKLRSAVFAELSPEKLSALSKLKPARSARSIVAEWLIIAAMITVCRFVQNPWMAAFAIVVIGSRQHSLAILMHEGAHYHLADNRALNDRIAELFTAWPLMISLPSYRANHFEHHRYANSMKDPDWRRKQNADWAFPKTRMQMAALWLKVVFHVPLKLAFTCLTLDLPRFVNGRDWGREVLRASYYTMVLIAIFSMQLGKDFLVFWLVPYYLVFMPIAHLRSIAEHFGLENNPAEPLTQTRTTKASLIESILICPNHINYHLDHHLMPSVPFYNLPALHQLLSRSSAYVTRASITQGYWGVIRECMLFRHPCKL